MSSIAQAMAVEFATLGELVVISIGNVAFSVEFNVALRVSAEMLEAARTAKRAANDSNRRFRVAGHLQDVEAEKVALSRWNRAAPPRLKTQDVSVRPVGTQVAWRLGKTVAEIPYEAALTFSQWLRIRGKEARNNAKESANWLEIAKS